MIFEVKDGSFSYPEEKEEKVPSGIDYDIKEGEILGILGKNGAGKTTLLRCSMGILKWVTGATFLDGEDIREVNNQKLWQKLSYVPQAKSINGSFTVEEMVLFGRSAYMKPWQQPGKKEKQIVELAMEQVGIADLRKRLCTRLSGGELQMVLIARALAGEPHIMILDEPESGLDFKNQLIILETMERLSHNDMLACIFNTHYPSHALQYADKVLLLDNEGCSMFGDSHELITKENLERIFEVKVDIHSIMADGKIFHEVLPLEVIHDKTS